MNPRKISDSQFKILCKSIQDNISYFEARPIILSDRTGEFIVIAGNQRYKAAKHLKLKKVPIYLMKELSLEQEKEIVIRDNISNGDWDWDILNTGAWGEISDLEEWGLDIPVFNEGEEPKEQKDLSGSVGETFEVIITCDGERDQEILFNKLKKEGYTCRVLTL